MSDFLPTALAAVTLLASAAAPMPSLGTTVDPHIVDGTAQRDLDAARATWREAEIRHYRMRVRTDCFCAGDVRRPRRIEVRDGRPVERAPAHLRAYATVWRLFARIQDAIDDEVAGLTVAYDKHGAPRSLWVDISELMADEEHGVRIVRFRVLD